LFQADDVMADDQAQEDQQDRIELWLGMKRMGALLYRDSPKIIELFTTYLSCCFVRAFEADD
jgi:hypothetical protein